MALNIPGGGTLAFAMMANGNAKFIEADAAGGTGTVGSGTMEKVDTTAYNTSKITGDYALGVAGLDSWNNRTAIAGRLTANGAGIFNGRSRGRHQSGMFTTWTGYAAQYTVSDTTSGRGIMILPPWSAECHRASIWFFTSLTRENCSRMEVDPVTILTPLLNGVVLRQQSTTGKFLQRLAEWWHGDVPYRALRVRCGKGTGPRLTCS